MVRNSAKAEGSSKVRNPFGNASTILARPFLRDVTHNQPIMEKARKNVGFPARPILIFKSFWAAHICPWASGRGKAYPFMPMHCKFFSCPPDGRPMDRRAPDGLSGVQRVHTLDLSNGKKRRNRFKFNRQKDQKQKRFSFGYRNKCISLSCSCRRG